MPQVCINNSYYVTVFVGERLPGILYSNVFIVILNFLEVL